MNYTSGRLTIRDHDPLRAPKIALDAAAANHLATFFPQLGARKRSNVAGAWMPTLDVDLKAADGTIIHVVSNFEVWSESRGDWATSPGLEAYIAELRREAERDSRPN